MIKLLKSCPTASHTCALSYSPTCSGKYVHQIMHLWQLPLADMLMHCHRHEFNRHHARTLQLCWIQAQLCTHCKCCNDNWFGHTKEMCCTLHLLYKAMNNGCHLNDGAYMNLLSLKNPMVDIAWCTLYENVLRRACSPI